MAARYVGRVAQPGPAEGRRGVARASTTRSRCSTGTGCKRRRRRARRRHRHQRRPLSRHPASATPSGPASRCCPRSRNGFPVTLSLAVGAAIIWLIMGVTIGVISALKRGSFFDRAAMTAGPGRRLAADLLDRPGLAGLLQLQARLDTTRGVVHATDREPARSGPTPCCCRGSRWRCCSPRSTPGSPGPACSRPWVRTTSARPGPRACRSAPSSSSTACASALTPIVTIFGLDFGLLIGGAVLTETVFGLPGLGPATPSRPPTTNDLPQVLARRADHRRLRGALQPDRRPAVRRHRPESADQMTIADLRARQQTPPRRRGPSSTSATCRCTSRPTTVW